MSTIPRVLGMVHLLPLPGSPGFHGSMIEIVDRAVSDATALASAGFPAVMVENFGDTPFFADSVPPQTIAAMSVAARAVAETTGLPFGVNVLRNDSLAALGIAAATGAALIRVNVLSGTMHTDQGPIVGRAAEVLRRRAELCPDVEVWADVLVKHAVPPAGADPARIAGDTVERAGADAVIVSGEGTGSEPAGWLLETVASAVPKGTRLVVGSGAAADNLSSLLSLADTVIVGSSLKVDGDARNQVDPLRAGRFVVAARDHGLL